MNSNTNALICIGSPLQAICAVEAISAYQINNYDFRVIDDGTRLGQIEKFLNKKNIKYRVIPFHVSAWKNICRLIGAFNPFLGKYDFLFIGDYRLTGNRMESIPLLKIGGNIVFLDDGSYIVNWSRGLLKQTFIVKFRNLLMNFVCELRKISYKNVFTIFASDIKMEGFKIRENRMESLSLSQKPLGDIVYFIGTNPSSYCSSLGIKHQVYFDKLRKILHDIRSLNLNKEIVYIPHGRDNTTETVEICKDENIRYQKLSVCIELFVLNLNICPTEILGLGSSALYTLKTMCPNSMITNILMKGSSDSAYDQYCGIAKVYEHKGIKTVFVH